MPTRGKLLKQGIASAAEELPAEIQGRCRMIRPIFFCFALLALTSHAWAGKNSVASGVEVVRAAYGSGRDRVGIATPQEANPEGPMSFALGKNGEIYILDQVNSRIQVFRNNIITRTIPIPGQTFFVDIDLTPDGRILLLDNLVRKAVYLLDSRGTVIKVLPLKGEGIPTPAAVTGVCSRADARWAGIWVTTGERSLRLAALGGTPAPRRLSLPGDLTLDGRRLMRADVSGRNAIIHLSNEDLSTWNRHQVSFNMHIAHILGLWDDRGGRIYLGAFLIDEPRASNTVVVLAPGGAELGRIKMPVSPMPHEVNRAFRGSPDGRIFHMALDKSSVVIRMYNPPDRKSTR